MIRESKVILVITILASLHLSGCSNSSGDAGTAERPAVAVETALVAPADIKESIEVVGTLTAKFEGEVKAEYSRHDHRRLRHRVGSGEEGHRCSRDSTRELPRLS